MALSAKQKFMQTLAVKKKAEHGLQAVGGQIRKNVAEGQRKDFDHSTRINPLKGAVDAYRKGYGG